MKKEEILKDYDNFVKKFDKELRKTTDDCYTPENVYKTVLDWLDTKVNLDEYDIVRPFYPGGDFESFDYPVKALVLDNPPFSIMSKIIEFYLANKIKFFLFADAKTSMAYIKKGVCYISAGQIEYENKALVNSAFITNLFEEEAIIVDPALRQSLQNLRTTKKRRLIDYSSNILTFSRLQSIAKANIDLRLKKDDVTIIEEVKQEASGDVRKLFGSACLIDTKKAREIEKQITFIKHSEDPCYTAYK